LGSSLLLGNKQLSSLRLGSSLLSGNKQLSSLHLGSSLPSGNNSLHLGSSLCLGSNPRRISCKQHQLQLLLRPRSLSVDSVVLGGSVQRQLVLLLPPHRRTRWVPIF
jgi:hypothetical protein